MIGLDGRDATASRPRARREGVHEESYDRSGRHRRYRQSTKGQVKRGCMQD